MVRRGRGGVGGGVFGAIRPSPAVAAAAGGVEFGLDEVARKGHHQERLEVECKKGTLVFCIYLVIYHVYAWNR